MRDRVAVPGEPDRVTARHAQCRRLELRTAGRTLLPGFPVVPRPQRAADRPLQSPCPLSQRRQTVFAMQGIAGNAAVQRLIGRAPATAAVRTTLRRCSCEGTAGTDGECEACRASRLAPPRATNSEIAVQREARPSQAAPSFVSTPAALATALPETVLAAHAEAVKQEDLTTALQIVAKAMEQRGDIDRSAMCPVTATKGAAVCSTTERYAVDAGTEGALMTSCGCGGPKGARLPNVRIQVGPASIQKAERLHATLLHEFRHVQQERARCNLPGTASSGSGICTDCNHPDEMDAYLAEIESGYEPMLLQRPWVRVYVNWPYLAPEQQQLFQGRRDAAERKIAQHFPKVPWEKNSLVAAYRAHCEKLNEAIRSASDDPAADTHGTCDDPLAPLLQKATAPGTSR
ncbi:MAG: hypothetical protein QOG89_3217 [Thermomicrobiales bacterium]|nr:hypothetical protein [Thermomicrobiales bacterium]